MMKYCNHEINFVKFEKYCTVCYARVLQNDILSLILKYPKHCRKSVQFQANPDVTTLSYVSNDKYPKHEMKSVKVKKYSSVWYRKVLQRFILSLITLTIAW